MQKKYLKLFSQTLFVIGGVSLVFGLSATVSCINIAYFAAKRANCQNNMKRYALLLQHEAKDKHLSAELAKSLWPKVVSECRAYSMRCYGLGAGASPYLLFPNGLKDTTLPILVERQDNHLEIPSISFLSIEKLTIPAGASVVFASGDIKWLQIRDYHKLISRCVESGKQFYDMDSNISDPFAKDPTGNTSKIHLNPHQINRLLIAVGLLSIGIGCLIRWFSRSSNNATNGEATNQKMHQD